MWMAFAIFFGSFAATVYIGLFGLKRSDPRHASKKTKRVPVRMEALPLPAPNRPSATKQPPSLTQSAIIVMANTEGYAHTIERIRAEKGWTFRQAAAYLANIMRDE